MMQTPIAIFVEASIIWAAVLSILQIRKAHGGGRKDYSRRAGDPIQGVIYNFTAAMTPAHKESVRRHPGKFAIGLLMHFGVFLSLAAAILCLIQFELGMRVLRYLSPLFLASLAAGLFLLVRRLATPDLRFMSYPDDYLSIILSCGWTGLAAASGLFLNRPIPFLVYTGLLMIYLPLGKLRHAIFFFAARWDYGRRLGYRGVYPPAPMTMESKPNDG
ncbi:MAG: hypothetical protein KJ970_08695 [Candidatus Eisenbacteria bacterium]|uniref:NarG-like domain-containing protein n=1 Tax=Eiseniibacteriota bacterium TaxID=2212470 RepID=A0A948RZA7_UNCEI|nr:hypothetical protein [Candidatus Eisenbacteria bacterium]MBU1950077.1 hypothetical protein [Candidatus Eisenbacteria bacterium]MBU2690994.1 hypothetical protein [Candidatus Eisenbacteria bacterium]